jgi:hypothetical protein
MPVTDGGAGASKPTGAVMLKIALATAAAVLLCATAGFAQKKGDELSNTRSVQGTVTTPEESPVAGAVANPVIYRQGRRQLLFSGTQPGRGLRTQGRVPGQLQFDQNAQLLRFTEKSNHQPEAEQEVVFGPQPGAGCCKLSVCASFL